MADYRLNDPDKGIIGPVRLETVRDLIAAGVVNARVSVSKDNGPFLAMLTFPELRISQGDPQAGPTPSFAGDLGKNTFFKVLYRFHASKASGLLRLERDSLVKDVFLGHGVPVFVNSNIVGERLGEYLIARNVLSRDELDVALASMHTDNHRIGYTLLRLGLVEPTILAEHLRGQQVMRLVDLSMWDRGRYAFYDGIAVTDDKVDLQLQVEELVVLAARALPAARLETRLDRQMHQRIERLPQQSTMIAHLKLAPFEQRVLDHIDGQRSLAQVLKILGAAGEQRRTALMVAYLLWELDAISFRA